MTDLKEHKYQPLRAAEFNRRMKEGGVADECALKECGLPLADPVHGFQPDPRADGVLVWSKP
jgi:hypothetical protein